MKQKLKYFFASLTIALSTWLPIIVGAAGLEGVSVDGTSITVDVAKSSGASSTVTTFDGFWNKILSIGKYMVSGITGVLCIAMVGIFAMKSVKFAKSGGNPKEKQEAIEGLLNAFIGAALLGATSLLSALAFGLFQ